MLNYTVSENVQTFICRVAANEKSVYSPQRKY